MGSQCFSTRGPLFNRNLILTLRLAMLLDQIYMAGLVQLTGGPIWSDLLMGTPVCDVDLRLSSKLCALERVKKVFLIKKIDIWKKHFG